MIFVGRTWRTTRRDVVVLTIVLVGSTTVSTSSGDTRLPLLQQLEPLLELFRLEWRPISFTSFSIIFSYTILYEKNNSLSEAKH